MMEFDFLEPASVAEACRALRDNEEARPIAGGTALVILMKSGILSPRLVVNLGKLPELRNVGTNNGAVDIGAMVTIHRLEREGVIRQRLPLLAQAAGKVGNIRVRSTATVGGSLAEADYQSDMAPSLAALDARVHIQSPDGQRAVPIDEFFVGPYETCLQRGELVIGVSVPVPPPGTRSLYTKHVVGPITDRPCLSVAGLLRLDEQGRIADLRVVLGGVSGISSRPLVLQGATDAARGERPDSALFEKIAEMAYQQADPISDLRGSSWYKRELARTLTRRTLEALTELPAEEVGL